MDKIKRPGRNLSLRKSLMLYIIIFTMIALALTAMTFSVCNYTALKIKLSYPPTGEKYYLTNEQGEQLGEGGFIVDNDTRVPMSKQDEYALALLELLPIIATPVYSALSIIAAAFLFYRNKLKKPLAELRAASEKISSNDLDFLIECDSRDELGQLCTSFEIMRAALKNNFSEMWRQMEERGQLNAAFAHELRTPLTVLKGYNEMLQQSEHDGTKEIAATMGKHLSRIETYVDSMSRLRRMEDTQPECRPVPLQMFLSSLYESANIVCAQNGKLLLLQNEVSVSQLSFDGSFILQVCNNLISNAVRYAKTTVTLSFSLQDNFFVLSVSDDGKGFDKSSLYKVTAPYYTEETRHSEHFGLGLYICKLLCEQHGGYLKIDNISNGSKLTAFFKCQPVDKK